jgi:FkbM family methyltransferase
MSFISYAQNYEDVRLWRAFNDVIAGRYLDIGTQDPVRDSVSLAFYERGWRGVHVEPTPAYAAAMRAARPDETVVEAAVTTAPGPIRLYEIPTTGLSTGIADLAQRHAAVGWTYKEITVATVTLAGLFDHMGPDLIHWLKVDVEGMEADVLASWGDHPARPVALVIEATAPNSQIPTHEEWQALVLARGYVEVLFDGLSRYFIHKSHVESGEALALSPNVFDGFQVPPNHFTAGMLAAEQENAIAAVRQQAWADCNAEIAAISDKLGHAEAQRQSDAAAASAESQAAQDLAARLKEQLHEEAQAHAAAVAEAQTAAAEASSRLERAMEQVAELQVRLAGETQAYSATLAEAQAEAAETSHRLQAATQQLVELEQQNVDQIRSHAATLASAHDRLAVAETTLAGSNDRLAALWQDHIALARENGRLEGQLTAQIETNSARLAEASADRHDLADRLSRAEQALAIANVDAARISAELAEQALAHDDALAAADAKQAEQAAALSLIANEADSHAQVAAGLSQQLTDSADQNHALTAQIAELTIQRDDIAAQLEAAQRQANQKILALHSGLTQLSEHIAWREQQLQQAVGLMAAAPDLLAGLPRLLTALVRWVTGEARLASIADHQAAAAQWQTETKLPAAPMSSGGKLSLAGNLQIADEASNHGGNVMLNKEGPITSVPLLLLPHDRHFIHTAYHAVLGRAPDADGEVYYLARLRSGVHKLEILKQLRQSAEGRAFIPGVSGLDRAIKRHSWATTPLVGVVVRVLTGGEGNSATHRHLRVLVNDIGRLRAEQAELGRTVRSLAERANDAHIAPYSASTAETDDFPFVAANASPQSHSQSQPVTIADRRGLAGFFQARIWSR